MDNDKKGRKYRMPEFLHGIVSQEDYDKWLHRKAAAHVRRDRTRGNSTAAVAEYKMAIHEAVKASGGIDAYTGEPLNWDLISKYDNEESKNARREYKKRFALLPSVDHVGLGIGPAEFRICAWRTNDAKSDLTYDEFIQLCQRVLEAASKSIPPTV